MVTGYYDDFAGYQEVTLARALARYAHVKVFAGDRVAPIFSDAVIEQHGLTRVYKQSEAQDGDVAIHRVPYQKISSLLLSRELFARLKGEHADLVLVLAVGQGFSAPSAWWPRGARRMTVFGDNRAQWAGQSVRTQWVKSQVFRWTKGLLYRAVIRRCDPVYVNTPDTRSRIAPFAGGKQLELLPLSVDASTFHPDEADRRRRRQDLGIPEGAPVLGVVGKASVEKRLELVLDAFSGCPDVAHCVMAGLGDDRYSQMLRDRVASDPRLRQRVTLLGFLSARELASLLRAADVCVWPVQPAITIQQAIVSGCRVVIPDNDIVGYLVQDGKNGRTFTEGSLEALHQAIAAELGAERSAGERADRAEHGSYLSSDATARRLLTDAGLMGGELSE